jgi:hypothetical protein
MGRRDKWKKVRDSINMQDGQAGKTLEERESMPEKGCGYCKKFSESAYSQDGRGSCSILKMGSDLMADPPVLESEGEAGLITYFNMDGAKCPHFIKMEFIDKDIGEISDPIYRRTHRQMEKE